MRKRFLAILLVITMMLSLMPVIGLITTAENSLLITLSETIERAEPLLYLEHSEQTAKYLYDRYQRAEAVYFDANASNEDITAAIDGLSNAVSLLADMKGRETVELGSFDSLTAEDIENMPEITGRAYINTGADEKPEGSVQAVAVEADNGVAVYSNGRTHTDISGISPYGADMSDTDGFRIWISTDSAAEISIFVGKRSSDDNYLLAVKNIPVSSDGYLTIPYYYFDSVTEGAEIVTDGSMNYIRIECVGASVFSFAALSAYREEVEESNSAEYSEERIISRAELVDNAYYKIMEATLASAGTYRPVSLGPEPTETQLRWEGAVTNEPSGMEFTTAPNAAGDRTQIWQISPDPSGNGTFRFINKASGCCLTLDNSGELIYREPDYNNTNQEWTLTAARGEFTIQVRGVAKLTVAGNTVKSTTATAKKFYIYKVCDGEYVETLFDDFDADKPDSSVWTVADGFFFGGGNGSIHIESEDNFYTEDGDLVLKTINEEYNGYQSSTQMVTSSGKYAISNGKFEFCAKMPQGYGMWPALWMMPVDSMNMASSEIDLMEMAVTVNEYDVYGDSLYARQIGTWHWSDENGMAQWSKPVYLNNEGYEYMSEDYHLYGVEVDKDQVRLYFDGMLYNTLNLVNDGMKYAFGDTPRYLLIGSGGLQGDGYCVQDESHEYNDLEMRIAYIKGYMRQEEVTDDTPDFTTESSTQVSSTVDVFAKMSDWNYNLPTAVAPDGTQAISVDYNGFLYVFDPNTNELLTTVSCAPYNGFCAAVYSRDGSKFAASTNTGSVLVYDTSDFTAEPVKIHNGATLQFSLVFTADSRYIITGGFNGGAQTLRNPIDGSVTECHYFRIFDASTGSVFKEIFVGSDPREFSLSPDGSLLALTTTSNGVWVFNTSDWSEYAHLENGHIWSARGCEFSPDGSLIATSDEGGEVVLWDVGSKTGLGNLKTVNKSPIRKIAFSPDGKYIVTNSNDTAARLYSVESGRCVSVLGGFGSLIREVEFSPDGRFIVAAGYDKTLKVYEANGTYLETLVQGDLADEGYIVSDICFTPDSKYVICGNRSVPRAINRWKLPSETDKSALIAAFAAYTEHNQAYDNAECVIKLKYATHAMVYDATVALTAEAVTGSFGSVGVAAATGEPYSESISVNKGAWLYFRVEVSFKVDGFSLVITDSADGSKAVYPVDSTIEIGRDTATDGYTALILRSHIDSGGEYKVSFFDDTADEYSQELTVNVAPDKTATRDFTYEITDNNEATITGCISGKSDVVIPDEIDGYPVTAIGAYALYAYGRTAKHMTLVLPSTLKTIEEYAFAYCTSLRELNLPDALEQIEQYAFYRCIMIASIDIPDSVTYVGSYAFSYVRGTSYIKIGSGMTTLGNYAFYDSIGNRTIILEEGITKVQYQTFRLARLLERVYIPLSMESFYPSSITSPMHQVTVYGYAGSYAQTFADSNSMYTFVELANPAITGVEEGGSYDLFETAQLSAEWDHGHIAYLNGSEYREGSSITEPGEYTLKVINGYDEFTTEVTFTVTDTSPIPGDVDTSGELTVSDALLTLRMAAELYEGDARQRSAADFDGDESITVVDALAILRKAIGLIN